MLLTFVKGETMLKDYELVLDIAQEVRDTNQGKNDWFKVAHILASRYGIVKSPNGCKKMFQRHSNKEEDVKRDWQESEGQYSSLEYRTDGTHISERKIAMSETDMKNPRFVLEAHGFNPDLFDLVSAKNNFWSGHNKEDGEVINYQSKITVRPKTNSSELTREDISSLIANFKPVASDFKLKSINTSKKEKLALEIDFADTHIGSLSWHEEVGEDNDYKIAFKKIYEQVAKAREIIDTYPIEKIYICFLGDFLHVDTEAGTTTKGTVVDMDSRPKKMVAKGLEILMYIIENLAVSDTEVIWIEGNHSRLVEYTLFQSLPHIYANAKHIKFDVRPIIRKSFFYKGNLVGLHHGEMKKDQLFNWIQVEFRELWAKSTYVEQHSGHIHQEKVTEKGGIIQRTNPTGKIQDLYEFENGWKSYKAVVAYLWSEKGNLKAQFYLR